MGATNPALDFLDEEFAPELRHVLPTALRRGYVAASRLMETEPFLATPGGKFQRGDLVAVASECEIERLITSGQLPFERTWEPYARPTGLHLVLWTARARLTISQVTDADSKPRHAYFRDNYAMTNQLYLFDFMNKELEEKKNQKHLLLVHGYKDLTFAHLAVPHAKKNRLIARSPNLILLPHSIGDDLPQAEGPTDSPDPEALDAIRNHLRDRLDD